ncbi:cob(I)yrinic acid a,c-diamide adenosyltransferase [Paraferrimonas sedimenticola]|uniref:Corrinoid adenosyltransferase n=1 Tax=Paraferrimonas sedimenticola TaxID=375674 RepID=A0AA37W2K2_9GAMM|nr:cob(I)yrinic acid a,c-diamide adenosyltransferase [Paraferrimonas sedimenticola]GLP98125.1 cob(I)alamin adenosyltransferase/cobinamide ATP-dependent adenosyltransferase [Paraferrimonas sedimenticola]
MTDKASKHQQRQQKLKEKVDSKVAQAQIERGVLLVLTGNGKGKTTAGFGNVLRAVGHGQSAAVVQFIKGMWDCGERNVLQNLGVQFEVMATGFTWETQNKEKDIAAAEKAWAQAEIWLQDPSIQLVLLDELTYMLSYHYLDVDRVLEVLAKRPEHQHVIITGRQAHRRLVEMADTVSDVQPTKHAFEAGIKAQKGFDY